MSLLSQSIIGLSLLPLPFLPLACSGDDLTPVSAVDGTADASTGPGRAPGPTADGGPSSAPPLYALGTLQFSTTGGSSSTTYINLVDSLGVQPDLGFATAREAAGYAPAAAIAGKVTINDGESPKITRYAIGTDKAWTEEASLSFASYAQGSLTQSIVASETLAFAPFDALSYVTWNPTTFALGATIAEPAIPLTRGDLKVTRGYAHAVSGRYAYQPFYYTNAMFTDVGRVSNIGVLDTTTSQWVSSSEVACPHLHITSKDDDGNVYVSNGQYSIAAAVIQPDGAKNCFVRIRSGETAVEAASLTYFENLTGGREGSNFFYVGNGKAFFNVYHAELDGAGPGTPNATIQYSSKYHLWTYDLATKQAAIMPGIDYAGGQFTSYRIDGRVYVAVPAPDYASTTVYEITTAGTAERRFGTKGWTFNIFKVR